MEEVKAKENLLLKTKSHILRMTNNKNRANLVWGYESLFKYYCDILPGNVIRADLLLDNSFTKKYEKYIIKDTWKNVVELENNSKILCEKFGEILDSYKNNEFCQYRSAIFTKVSKEKMEQAIYDFFASLGDDVLKIYYDMATNGNIFLTNIWMERLGYSLDSRPIDNPCITMQNVPYYLEFYTTLAHEIGHCYQFYLQKDQRSFAMLDPYSEITSLLFEKLFIEYLKRTHAVKDLSAFEVESHVSFVNEVSVSKALCKLLLEDKSMIIDPFCLNYISKKDSSELEKEITEDCGYVQPIDAKADLEQIQYAFSGVIADYFFKKIVNDFSSGWKEFKDFICTVRYLPMDEVIEKYFDINMIDENVKKFTKSYR